VPDTPTLTPTPKVLGATAGAAFGGAVGTVLTWAVDNYHLLSGQPLPSEVKAAIAVIITTIISYAGGWFVRPNPNHTAILQDQKYVTAIHT
jgi:hypothetical protein